MRKILFLLLLLPFFSKGQVSKPATIPFDSSSFYRCNVEIEATVDRKTWITYINDHFKTDDIILDSTVTGPITIIVQFVVGRTGKITDVSVEKDPGFGLAEKAISTVADYPGLWKPSMKNGRPVKSYHRQPFIVEVSTMNDCEERSANSF